MIERPTLDGSSVAPITQHCEDGRRHPAAAAVQEIALCFRASNSQHWAGGFAHDRIDLRPHPCEHTLHASATCNDQIRPSPDSLLAQSVCHGPVYDGARPFMFKRRFSSRSLKCRSVSMDKCYSAPGICVKRRTPESYATSSRMPERRVPSQFLLGLARHTEARPRRPNNFKCVVRLLADYRRCSFRSVKTNCF